MYIREGMIERKQVSFYSIEPRRSAQITAANFITRSISFLRTHDLRIHDPKTVQTL